MTRVSARSAPPLRPLLPRSKRLRRVLAAFAVAVLAFVAVTVRLLVMPATGSPGQVSAIVMYAGPGDRLDVALALARAHRAGTLVVSQGWQGYGGPCPVAPAGIRLICFEPDPGNTRGEAEAVGRLARENHWTSIILVTTRPQDTRARILTARCFSGSIYAETGPIPWTSWPYQIAYGWGALVKALVVHTSC
jgi:uncharacterized SAM-binding protein YcdF (DUF218 family)